MMGASDTSPSARVPELSPRWAFAVARVLARHPSLWSTAATQIVRLAPRGWWRRAPFLPMPAADYLAFRSQTMYGDAAQLPAPDDVVTYLHWCRHFPSRSLRLRNVQMPTTAVGEQR